MASASTQVAASIGLSKTDATVEATLEYVRKGYLYKKVTKSLCFYLLHFRLISGGSVLLAIVLCFFGPAGNDMLYYPTIIRSFWSLITTYLQTCEICYAI
jgi:hypothetical protein